MKYNLDSSESFSIASDLKDSLRAIAESKPISALAVTPSIKELFKNPLASVIALSAERKSEPLLPEKKLFSEVGMGIGAAAGTGASAMDFLLSDESF